MHPLNIELKNSKLFDFHFEISGNKHKDTQFINIADKFPTLDVFYFEISGK